MSKLTLADMRPKFERLLERAEADHATYTKRLDVTDQRSVSQLVVATAKRDALKTWLASPDDMPLDDGLCVSAMLNAAARLHPASSPYEVAHAAMEAEIAKIIAYEQWQQSRGLVTQRGAPVDDE